MPTTYEPIATTTLGSTSTTINFTSIPSTYTDLRLVLNAVSATSSPTINFRFNSSSSGYARLGIWGRGDIANLSIDFGQSSINLPLVGGFNTTNPTLITADIFSYAGSTIKEALFAVSRDNNGSGSTEQVVTTWDVTTAAITSINLSLSGDAFGIGTTATLYGIKAA